jgi:hypothetical protein
MVPLKSHIGFSSCFLLVLLLGCSDNPTRHSVKGRVLIDGKPLAMGTIRFVPKTGRALSSNIMADGSFVMSERSLSSSRMTDGVAPGNYRVSVSASKILDEDLDEVEWLAPSRYADFRTSGLQMEIDQSEANLVVDLTWDDIDSTQEQIVEKNSLATEKTEK